MKQTLLSSADQKKLALRSLLLLFSLTIITGTAFSQKTWTGNTDSDWNNAANWNGGVPGSGDAAIIANAGTAPVIAASQSALAKSVLVEAGATLTIAANASLKISGKASYSAPFELTAAFNNLGTVANSGELIIGSAAEPAQYGILNQNTFTNNDGGNIQLNHIDDTALFNASGTFSNDASILIGDAANVGNHGIWNDGTFTNNAIGNIQIDRSSLRAIVNNSNAMTLGGLVTIGKNAEVGANAIENKASLNISACGKLIIMHGNLVNEASQTIINNGLINLNNTLTNSGNFTNNSVLKYGSLTGIMTNNSLIINDLNQTIFSYGAGFSGTVNGIFKDSEGNESAGTFTAPNTFVADESVLPGLHTLYAKVTPDGGGCLFLVAFTTTISSDPSTGQTTWQGTTDPDWNNPANWTDGLPGAGDDVIIPSFGIAPIISPDQSISIRSLKMTGSLTISANSTLTITGYATHTSPVNISAALLGEGNLNVHGSIIIEEAAGREYGIYMHDRSNFDVGILGKIQINGSTRAGIHFNGTEMNNHGSIIVGDKSSIGEIGMNFNSRFENHEGARIQIDRSTKTGLSAVQTGISFTNSGTINIGGAAGVGNFGIENGGNFVNNETGIITVDRSTSIGIIVNEEGAFNNGGTTTIGGLADVGQLGLAAEDRVSNFSCARFSVLQGDALINGYTQNFGYMRVAEDIYGTDYLINEGVLNYGSNAAQPGNYQLIVNNGPGPIFTYGLVYAGNIEGIYKDQEATILAGTFTAPNTFVHELPFGTHTLYAKVKLDNAVCGHIMPFQFENPVPLPELNVKGNNITISNGDNTPSASDHTNFGQHVKETGEFKRVFKIENAGPGILNLTGDPKVSLSGSSDFSVTVQPASPVVSTGNTTFEITFSPTSLGSKTATVSITSDDPDENPYTFAIQGEGVSCITETTTGTLTWQGTVDSDWNNGCNWFPNSIPTDVNDIIIEGTDNQPVIGPGTVVAARTIEVKAGATLIISESASLSISNTIDVSGTATAFYNAGTVQNNGRISLGQSADINGRALWNAGNFDNNACANLYVKTGSIVNDASKVFKNWGLIKTYGNLTNDGTFTNAGVANYGSLTGDLTNDGIIVNNSPEPIFAYGSSNSSTVAGIFKDSEATESAGIFTGPNSFQPDASLTIGQHQLYAKINADGGACTFIVAFVYESLPGQTTWTGAQSSAWDNAANWTAGVPTTLSHAIIPDVATNDPVVLAGSNAVTGSILVQSGGSLTIETSGNLNVRAFLKYTTPFPFDFSAGLSNLGAVTNYGNISVGAAVSVASYAIVNQGTFDNKPGSKVQIDHTSDSGLFNAFGTFTNESEIVIGASGNVGLHGIWNDATFANNGQININRSTLRALMNNADETKSIAATFNNAGNITIGALEAVGRNGIENLAAFNNKTGGDIQVNGSTENAIYHASGAFLNEATISIGGISSAGNAGLTIWSDFTNKPAGQINIDRVTNFGLRNTAGRLTNEGKIIIGNIDNGGKTGLENTSILTNAENAEIRIDLTSDAAIHHISGTFTNAGLIVTGDKPFRMRYGMWLEAAFTNTVTGEIRVNLTSGGTVGINHTGGLLNNSGAITLGSKTEAGQTGISLSNDARFDNLPGGAIKIDHSRASGIDIANATLNNFASIILGSIAWPGNYGLQNRGTFTNQVNSDGTRGELRIDQTVNSAIKTFGTFTNDADITIGSLASAGKNGIEFYGNAQNNAGGIIRIDQVTISGVETNQNFTNAGTIIIGANEATGRYGILNRGNFQNLNGANLNIDRTLDAAFYQTIATTSFSNAGNVTIGAIASVGKVGLETHSAFTNSAGGKISIDNSTDVALSIPAGTFTNAADITIGGKSAVGLYGLVNRGIFDNNTGGKISIDRSSDTGLYGSNGTFTNKADITIGGIENVGVHGIFNEAAFINAGDGNIRIDHATLIGLRNFNGTFSNETAITIGKLSPITSLLRQDDGVFTNRTNGILHGSGTITSANFIHDGGTLSPGYSPGKMTFNADKDFAKSNIEIEINGPGTPGVDYDQLVVSGKATLGGALHVSTNYTPQDGDEITILSASEISGEFSSYSGPVTWRIIYGLTSITLVYDRSLPVNLVAFNARAGGNGVQLSWQTATEVDNAGFHIERSGTGYRWEEIGFVAGKGTTKETQDYRFGDENPLPGINYYRLRQVDLDGKTTLSRIQAVRFMSTETELVVWADEARQAHIKTLDKVEKVTVFDMSGRILAVSGESSLDLSHVPSGILLVRVHTANGIITRKLMLW